MRLIFLPFIVLLILSACQSEEPLENADSNPEESTMESSEESPGEESAEKQGDNQEEQNGTSFDIHSEAVQSALFNPDNADAETLTFPQDVITEGMTQSEVEELYGIHDLVYPGHGGPVVVYGNLGVNYSDSRPFMSNDEGPDGEVNPDENTVTDVMFYAGLPYDEVVDALGAPDKDVYETEGGPVSGLQLMEYEIEEKENSTITGTFWLHDSESGGKMVDVMTVDEVPDETGDPAGQESQETEGTYDEEERIALFIEGYIEGLMAYYNDGDEDILTFTEETSPNFEKVSANRASGNYTSHETYDHEIMDISIEDTNKYKVTVSREYSHATSDGRRVTEVEYTLFETPRGFKVFDYQELNDEPAD